MRRPRLSPALIVALLPATATAAHAAPTTYANRAEFASAVTSVATEDFQEARVPTGVPNAIVGMSVSSLTNNSVFRAGEIVAGVTFTATDGGNLAAIAPSATGLPTLALGGQSGAGHRLTFSTPVDALALDIYNATTSVQIDLFDGVGARLGTFTRETAAFQNPGAPAPSFTRFAFFGASLAPADGVIASAVVSAPSGGVVRIDNVSFRATAAAVPEPGAVGLVGWGLVAGLVALGARRRWIA